MSEAMNLQDALLRQVLKERIPVTLFLMNGVPAARGYHRI